jgi:hypothetical protein
MSANHAHTKFIFQGCTKCKNICCAEDSSEPFQPRSKTILEKTSQASGVGKNFQVRTFKLFGIIIILGLHYVAQAI